MDSETDFQALVRASGIVFTTNVGQGAEEWVLAITTPTLKRTQVATQADLVSAGFIRVDALKHLESERERLTGLLAVTNAHIQTLNVERQAREAAIQALDLRARRGEAWKRGEHEGVLARNQGSPVEANPHAADAPDDAERDGHQAWRHGWRMRDTLLDLSERLRAEREGHQVTVDRLDALETAWRALEAGYHQAVVERDALAERVDGAEAEALAADSRSRQLQALLATIIAEAPHSPTCALWTAAAKDGRASIVACDCWRARVTGPVLPPLEA